mgnify:CR=1 FL=1
MRLLLLGCTGFVGKELVPTLLNENHEIYIVSRKPISKLKLDLDFNKLKFDFKSGVSERIVRDYYKERKPGQSITDWLDTKPREYFLNIPLELAEGGKVLFLSDYLKQKQKPKIKRLNLDSAAPGKSLSELTEAEREVVNKLLKLTFGGND